jgi:Viral BACON domain
LRILYFSLFALAITFLPTAAHAYPGGIAGYSGKSGSTCASCHSTGTKPTITMALPATVTSGQTYTLTLSEAGVAGNGGLDVAGSAGTFTAGTGTQILSGELVQSSASTTHSWTFSWTAPTVTTSTAATLYGAAMDSYGGGTGTIVANTTVTPAVVANPAMKLAPTSLAFSYQIGGATPAAQTVAVTSSTSTAISYTASTATAWLTTTASGTTPGSLSIGINPSGLAAGTYTGSVAVASSGASNSPQSVPVTLTVTAATTLPTLNVSPTSVTFNYQIGGTTPAAQNVATSSSTSTAITYTATSSAAWLSTTASGTTPGTLALSVNPASLAAGTYTGTVSIASAGEAKSPVTLPVTLNVTAAATKPALTLSPTSVTFSFQIGGSTPAAQKVATSSTTSTAITYSASTSTAWLTASGSGATPGSINLSVNPSGLAAGTYTGSVSVTGTGASNSPVTLPVTLNVTSATSNPTLNLTPSSLAFSYAAGGAAPAAKTLSLASSTGSALSYTAVASGGSWLSIGSTSGNTPGSISVSVNPASMAVGTYNGTITVTSSGASNSPQSVPVTLTVTSGTGSGHLIASPRWISFNYAAGQSAPSPKSVSVTSSGTALSYTAAAFGGSWLSVSPSGGTTAGKVNIAVNPDGLPTGSYAGVVQISAPGSHAIDLPVVLNVGSSGGGGGEGGDDSAIQAMPITSDPAQSGSVNAKWVSGMGVPNAQASDPQNQGLLISKTSTSDTKASAGIVINNADGMALTALGFDIRNGSHCTARTPAFVVVTSDGVNHTVGGCSKGTKQASPAQGWVRMRFDPSNPAQATPPIASGTTVKTIQLVVTEGPEGGSGLVIVDNILVNRTVIGKQ